VLAVVLSLDIVPKVMLEAFSDVRPEPTPVTVLNAPTFALKDPAESLRTRVFGLLAAVPVVLALGTVPDAILEPFKLVMPAPLPEILVAVRFVALALVVENSVVATFTALTTFAANDPVASRRTRVDAPLDDEAVVLAFSIVPVAIFDAFRLFRPEPSPANPLAAIVVAVTTFAANDPVASRRTRVDAPLADEPVVLALGTVPVATLDPFKFVS
jgi:hypothetical protein